MKVYLRIIIEDTRHFPEKLKSKDWRKSVSDGLEISKKSLKNLVKFKIKVTVRHPSRQLRPQHFLKIHFSISDLSCLPLIQQVITKLFLFIFFGPSLNQCASVLSGGGWARHSSLQAGINILFLAYRDFATSWNCEHKYLHDRSWRYISRVSQLKASLATSFTLICRENVNFQEVKLCFAFCFGILW